MPTLIEMNVAPTARWRSSSDEVVIEPRHAGMGVQTMASRYTVCVLGWVWRRTHAVLSAGSPAYRTGSHTVGVALPRANAKGRRLPHRRQAPAPLMPKRGPDAVTGKVTVASRDPEALTAPTIDDPKAPSKGEAGDSLDQDRRRRAPMKAVARVGEKA